MKRRIIIADNSEVFCNGLVQSLKKYDMVEVVGAAHDGEQTVRMVKQLKPDMLVLDLLLPKLDGIGVLKEIYNMEKRPIVVATSGFITDYVASSVACLGARYLMLKPCDITSLSELIEGCWNENDLQKRPRESTATRIENLATDVLHDIGVPAHIKGYYYLREAVIITVEDMDVINALSKVLYPQVARIYQTTPSRVERAIRHATEIAWDRRDQTALDRFFGTTVNKREDKPTVAEFLSAIADDIQRTMRTL
ncbi:MAG: sporulation transcription factor Spo0A [Oscillospiraceae bacterium]|nr:sporulation transcription factor Spo0A [Oscillospiraceae bacterium]